MKLIIVNVYLRKCNERIRMIFKIKTHWLKNCLNSEKILMFNRYGRNKIIKMCQRKNKVVNVWLKRIIQEKVVFNN